MCVIIYDYTLSQKKSSFSEAAFLLGKNQNFYINSVADLGREHEHPLLGLDLGACCRLILYGNSTCSFCPMYLWKTAEKLWINGALLLTKTVKLIKVALRTCMVLRQRVETWKCSTYQSLNSRSWGDIHMRSAHSEANLQKTFWVHGVKRGTILVCYLLSYSGCFI